MDSNDNKPTPEQSRTIVERISDRELAVMRSFDASAHMVFQAWTTPELFMRWWAPRSMGVPLRSCVMDARARGTYRIEFGQDALNSKAFFGTYVEVTPDARLVWTNEEGEDGAVTTVTFEQRNGQTLLTFRELYPSKEALDEACIGMEGGMPEQFEQLDELLASLGVRAGTISSAST